jgi:hypothetical protein
VIRIWEREILRDGSDVSIAFFGRWNGFNPRLGRAGRINRYEIVYIAVDEKPEWPDISLKRLVGERGFESLPHQLRILAEPL